MLKGNALNPQIMQYLESLNRLAAGREKIVEMQNKLMETNQEIEEKQKKIIEIHKKDQKS